MQVESSRKFHFMREIASGGFGSVYLAKVIHRDGFSRLAAIKLLHPKWSENEEVASRMRDEARLLGQLRHRNIVDVFDLTLIDGRVAVIMEYLEAVDLRSIINDCIHRGLLLPTRVALDITADVASALDAAYNRPPIPGERPLRVIHRDIKPSNVMIDESGRSKVLDFGVARADFEERESHTQEVAFGSVEYMPPERLFFEPESPASDVYSLGATLFELLALERFGKAKLRPEQHEEMIFRRLRYLTTRNELGTPAIRAEVKTVLTDMLAFDESDRPSAAQVAETLRTIARASRDEPTLAEFTEKVVPPLLEVQCQSELKRTPNPLVDQVLEEDSQGFPRTPTQELFSGSATPGSDDATELGGPAPVDEARWNALKEATLAEIKAQPGPTPAPSVRTVVPRELPQEPKERPARRPPARERAAPKGGSRVLTASVVAGSLVAVFVSMMLGLGVGVAIASGTLPIQGLEGLVVPPGGEGTAAPVLTAPAPAPVPTVAPSVAPTVAPSAEPAPTPTEATPVAPAVAPAGAQVIFVNHEAEPKKLTVRCDGGAGEGIDRVALAVEGLGECVVMGIARDRSRRTVVIEKVVEGQYDCFRGEDKTCSEPGSASP